jgi:hypothetical protein
MLALTIESEHKRISKRVNAGGLTERLSPEGEVFDQINQLASEKQGGLSVVQHDIGPERDKDDAPKANRECVGHAARFRLVRPLGYAAEAPATQAGSAKEKPPALGASGVLQGA